MFWKTRLKIVLALWGAPFALYLVLLFLRGVTDIPGEILPDPVMAGAGVCVLIFFFPALYLARRIVRPLEERNRRERQFLSAAEHAIKTPLSVISASADLLTREDPDNRWAECIKQESRELGELVTGLLDLSRCGSETLRLSETDLSDLVRGAALSFEGPAYERGLSLRVRIESGIRLNGDPALLRVLVSALLDNAVCYATAGTEILLTLSRSSAQAALRIRNASEPLSPEETGRLFERFYRPVRADRNSGGHYGLGLPTAKAIAESHGGKIAAEYAKGRMTVTVSLPV